MVPLSVTERADRCKGHNRIGGTGVCRQSDGWIFKYFKTNGALLASAVRQLIAGLEKGAVLFHCTAGKDRPEFWHPVFSLSAGFPMKILSQIMR